ncbi:hypothetical protein JR316_0010701 [Psilocybe cubensis]|uniref:Uncharacterized protein n=1 Tax=Psilocybe cubensis TaxID=181762 RepID=A0ACB8GNJ2_PSICU|nr:hypothetical protein JR316_0010701 [Psilocybe cubensis]KAH9476786.1 hypothetical protein JR316_0010701 [Psilocybe cubensis]
MASAPAPIGGTVYPGDFGPSVLFMVLYAALVPLMLYRMFDPERVAIFALRTIQSRSETQRFASGIVSLLRCMLVNPTYGSEMYFQSPAAATKGGTYSPPPPGTPDVPRLRARLRRLMAFMSLTFFAAIVPGIISNSGYSQNFHNQDAANRKSTLRFASAAINLALCLTMVLTTVWSLKWFPSNSKRETGIVFTVASLMAVISIYRLSVNHFKVTSLAGPSPLNSSGAKAAFYIFHVFPEWVANTILLFPNIRKLFGTGAWGDFRFKDMTPDQVRKWNIQQEKKERKRKARLEMPGDAIPLQEKAEWGSNQSHD